MSTFSFAPHEIFEIIAKTEITVARFYEYLANMGLGEEASKVFRSLSAEESEHGMLFQKMAQSQKESHDISKEFSVNMREILENAIARIDRSLLLLTPVDRKNVDLFQCLGVAIRHEKDSIMVYQEMRTAMPHEFSDVFEKTIAIEKEHLKVLEKVLKDMRQE